LQELRDQEIHLGLGIAKLGNLSRIREEFIENELDEEALKSKLEEVRKLVPYIKIEKRKQLASRLKNKDEYDGFWFVFKAG
jgi:hypothetical protein